VTNKEALVEAVLRDRVTALLDAQRCRSASVTWTASRTISGCQRTGAIAPTDPEAVATLL
jgi:hypothetical protein